MKIAQIVPPWLAVPPVGYGGTERVVDLLTKALVARGHEVTLFATNDSYRTYRTDRTYRINMLKVREVDLGGKHRLRIVSVFEKHLGNDGELKKNPLLHLLQVAPAFLMAQEFDVIHNHAQYSGLFFADFVSRREITRNLTRKNAKIKIGPEVVHTWHGTVDPKVIGEDKVRTLQMFKRQNFVSISNSQRLDMPELNWVGTVYNAVDLREFELAERTQISARFKTRLAQDTQDAQETAGGGYLAWLGRITPNKGVETAIEVAKRAGIQVRLAAFIDPIDRPYFEQKIKPKIDGRQVQLVGELKTKERSKFLGGAMAFLFPIQWSEPFGLVMIEAMSCGTPVIAFDRGSVAEVVKDGETGYIIKSKIKNQKLKTHIKNQKLNNKYQIAKTGVEGMVEAVRQFKVQSSKFKVQMRRNCRKWVEERFTKEKMVEGYEGIYNKISNF